MVSLLSKIFIKDRFNYSDKNVRHQYGMLCGFFGIFLNLVLFAFKAFAGFITKSIAVTSDAFNNLSDAASSIVQILGFKLSSKKPDMEHPFGHGRMEYISGLIISFFIFLMGFELLKTSFEGLFKPAGTKFSLLSVSIMIFSILVKTYMYFYNHTIGKKIDSVSMEAVAKDSLSDCIATFVVILSAFLGRFTSFPVDSVAGLIVALCIIYAGYDSAKETIAPLLGTPPSKQFVEDIEKELLAHKPIIAMHDLIVHDYGPGRTIVSLHAEVPGDRNIFELHDVIDNAEVDIGKKFDCQATIHLDPIDTKNIRLAELTTELKEILPLVEENLFAHDIRMVPGTSHTNLIFDVVKPFSCKCSNVELSKKINEKIKEKHPDINCVITVDSPFVK